MTEYPTPEQFETYPSGTVLAFELGLAMRIGLDWFAIGFEGPVPSSLVQAAVATVGCQVLRRGWPEDPRALAEPRHQEEVTDRVAAYWRERRDA